MTMFDRHPNVLAWASESVSIPYRNPFTGKQTVYIPDFLVVYVDKDGSKFCEMIEVKPLKEVAGYQRVSETTGRPLRTSQKDQATQILNAAKWQAALAYCARNGFRFRVVTEDSLFGKPGKKR